MRKRMGSGDGAGGGAESAHGVSYRVGWVEHYILRTVERIFDVVPCGSP